MTDRKHMLAALRMQSVTRWHIVNTTRRQNLAEHSLNVGIIASRIATLMAGLNHYEACYWGCIHDIEEVVVGDTPSHVKAMLRAKQADPVDLTGFAKVPDQYKPIVKIADMMEACFWLQDSCGDSHARQTLAWVTQRMDAAISKLNGSFKEAVMVVLSELRSGPYVEFDLAWQP